MPRSSFALFRKPAAWLVAVAALGIASLVASYAAQQPGRVGPVAKAAVSTHFGRVPADAAFFLSFRVADLWTSADGKLLRQGVPGHADPPPAEGGDARIALGSYSCASIKN